MKHYFSHDYGARNTLQSQALINEGGIQAYGIYWFIIEYLHELEDHALLDKDYVYKSLAYQLKLTVEELKKHLDLMFSLELLILEEGKIISLRVLQNVNKMREISEAKRRAGKASGVKRWGKDNESAGQVPAEPVPEEKPKEIPKEPKPRKTRITQSNTPEQDVTKENKEEEIKLNNPSPLKVWEFLPLFNELKKEVKPTSRGHQSLATTEKANLNKLIKKGYTKADFEKVIKQALNSDYVQREGLDIPDHVLREINFERYLNKSDNTFKGDTFISNRG